jgi:tetratricopeptide (TPR) repeat protein
MSQRMTVVSQLHWKGLTMQLIVIAALVLVAYVAFPNLKIIRYFLVAAWFYFILCRIIRAIFTRDQNRGMRAVQARNFQDAISHFESSYRFFSTHRQLDKWRSVIFGVSSQNSYRVTALCDSAYCYSRIGDRQRAITLLEQALQEEPDCAVAKDLLDLLRSGSSTPDTTSSA